MMLITFVLSLTSWMRDKAEQSSIDKVRSWIMITHSYLHGFKSFFIESVLF